MTTCVPYLRLVHSQPVEECVTVPVFRSVGFVWLMILVGCLAVHATLFYFIWRIVKCVSLNQS